MLKRVRIPYLFGGLVLISSLIFNAYTSILVFELAGKVEEFYQKDFVDVRVVSELLMQDIEKDSGKKLPPVELNIRLSKYSNTGIMYDGNVLRLFLPPTIVDFSDNQKRVYLAHEFGHYVLGHMGHQNPSTCYFFGTGDLSRDIMADSFVLKFSSLEDLLWVINELVWDKKERETRLAALGG